LVQLRNNVNAIISPNFYFQKPFVLEILRINLRGPFYWDTCIRLTHTPQRVKYLLGYLSTYFQTKRSAKGEEVQLVTTYSQQIGVMVW